MLLQFVLHFPANKFFEKKYYKLMSSLKTDVKLLNSQDCYFCGFSKTSICIIKNKNLFHSQKGINVQ